MFGQDRQARPFRARRAELVGGKRASGMECCEPLKLRHKVVVGRHEFGRWCR